MQEQPPNPSENLSEYPKLPIYYLAERLGLPETTDMQAIRRELLLTEADSEERSRLAIQYHLIGEALVNAQASDEAQTMARVALNILVATIYRDSQRPAEYIEELESLLDDVHLLILDKKDRYDKEELAFIWDIIREAIEIEEAQN